MAAVLELPAILPSISLKTASCALWRSTIRRRLTALGNDLGYENVFAKQIEYHATSGDMVIAISSSGKSPNILAGVATARQRDCEIVTFSGFTETNDLRKAGDVNFYVRAMEYGFVEVAHLSICHAILDLDMGWGSEKKITFGLA